jgi:mxaC protein
MSFDQPLWLWLLPLVLLPLLARPGRPLANSWAAQLPRDLPSLLLHGALRAAGSMVLLALVVGLAGPHRPEEKIERVGQGAEIVLLLDRSRSMDEPFAGARAGGAAPKGTGPEALDYYHRLRHAGSRQAKGKVARQILSDFTARRPQDLFGMVVFSTLPMPVLPFTQKRDAIQAAITAGNIGRGLSETNIAAAMLAALAYFEDRAYTGSRLILLVSDGGDRIDPEMRERITQLTRKLRVAVYWIYIRTSSSPGLMQEAHEPPTHTDTVPEYFLHHFFQQLGTPYHAYEAENPEALQAAIDDVNRLENRPITYLDTLPRRDLSPLCWGLALLLVLVLLGASGLEIRSWS